MFECRSCLAKSIRALVSSEPSLIQYRRQVLALTPQLTLPQRRHASLQTKHLRRDNAAIPLDTSRSEEDISPVPKRHLELELKWLKDRVKMAKYVRELIYDRNELEKAVALVRLASQAGEENQYIVAWNHILRWHIMQGRHNRAFSLFNDMKKRGQIPDSYTYLIMLSGPERTRLQAKKPSSANLARVVQIFDSMYKPNSGATPKIMHANAAIKACADAGDIDSLWTILSRLSEEGEVSADNVTYTIILDAIRYTTFAREDAEKTEEQPINQQIDGVEQGRTLWNEITRRWRASKVQLDEKLIVAMARLLLASPRLQDWDAVLTLVHQTCNIERQLPAISDPSRKIEHIPEHKHLTRPIVNALVEGDERIPTENVFEPFGQVKLRHGKDVWLEALAQYAKPGNAILSMLLDAIRKIRSPSTARKYWTILVGKPYEVKPDISNVEKMLQICALNRQSGLAAQIVCNELPGYDLKPRAITLRIAMDACLRNKKSDRTELDADKLLQVMLETSNLPDMQAVEVYLQLAISTKSDIRIAHAIEQLQAVLTKLQTLVAEDSGDVVSALQDTQVFLRTYDGAISTLLQTRTGDDAKSLLARRAEGSRLLFIIDKMLSARRLGELFRPEKPGKSKAGKLNEPLPTREDEMLGTTPRVESDQDYVSTQLKDDSRETYKKLVRGYMRVEAVREEKQNKAEETQKERDSHPRGSAAPYKPRHGVFEDANRPQRSQFGRASYRN